MKYLKGMQVLFLKVLAGIPCQSFRKFVLRLLGSQIDRTTVLYGGFEIRSPRKLKIGANSCIGHRATLDARGGLTIGKNVNFSSEVMIWTAQHDWRDPMFGTIFKPVVIGDYTWLGPRCIILPGVTVGEGSVIAAGAVVTKDIAPYTVVAGVPAQKIADRPRNLNYNPAGQFFPFI
jgi:acetyltransferase-like isoleucine patch superfamily enzyme